MRTDATGHRIVYFWVIGVDRYGHVHPVLSQAPEEFLRQHGAIGKHFNCFVPQTARLCDQLRQSAMKRRLAADELNRTTTQCRGLREQTSVIRRRQYVATRWMWAGFGVAMNTSEIAPVGQFEPSGSAEASVRRRIDRQPAGLCLAMRWSGGGCEATH